MERRSKKSILSNIDVVDNNVGSNQSIQLFVWDLNWLIFETLLWSTLSWKSI